MGDTKISNLAGFSKPALKLVDKISDFVGGAFKPMQLVRVARAEGKAKVIAAKAEACVSEIEERAIERLLNVEAKRQANIENIVGKSIQYLEDDASPEEMEDDWVSNLFDKAGAYSNEDVQDLWSRILAGEANSPGTFSRRTVNLLADLDQNDGEAFRSLCGFAWSFERETLAVFDFSDPIYVNAGIQFNVLMHLDSLGLIRFESGISSFIRKGFSKKVAISYFGRTLVVEFVGDDSNTLNHGTVTFTAFGMELFRVCAPDPVDGFFEYSCEKFREQPSVESVQEILKES